MKYILSACLFLAALLVFGQKASRKTENIIIITLDGLRWQEVYTGADPLLVGNKNYVEDSVDLKKHFWAATAEERRKKLMPFFWSTLATQGQLYGNRHYDNKVNCTNTMWFSYPGYNEILCGFADDERIHSNDKIENPNTTVLEFLNRMPAYKGRVMAFGSWDVFPFIINESRSGVPVNAGFEKASGPKLSAEEIFLNELQFQIPALWGSVRMDAFTYQYALAGLKKDKPKVTYIAFGETDDFAHDGKYDSYLASAHRTDGFIAALWAWVQSQRAYKDKTTLIITTDHGRGTVPPEKWRHHGDEYPGADQLWIAVLGPDTPPLGEVKTSGQLYQNQVAKTAAAFLGVEYKNERKTGDIISTSFKD